MAADPASAGTPQPGPPARRAAGETVGALLLAAGEGRRLGAGPKAFVRLAGRTILEWALEALASVPPIERTVVVAPSGRLADAVRLVARHGSVAVVAGGETRQASVAAGLAALGEVGWVVVHDAARPLATAALVERVLAASRASGAATAAIPAHDTVKVVRGGIVERTLDRDALWLVQTPQAFRAALLREAHARAAAQDGVVTDDAALVEALGVSVAVTEGDPANLKITTPQDLATAEALLARAGGDDRRTGLGYDFHRLVPGRRLVLGGIEIPHDRGLAGHSDADVVLHAVMDALLGAAALPDIGHLFPPGDPRYRDADSRRLTEQVVSRLREAGFVPAHVDVVVLAEAPRLTPHVEAMRERIAAALGVAPQAVGLKATTVEGLGALGRGEGIAAHAVATVARARGRAPETSRWA